jgi:small GTP-binding protein
MNSYRICVIGDSGVGKTTLLESFTQDKPSTSTPLNIFVSTEDARIIQWWDFSGSDSYADMRKMLYNYFDGYLFVYDLSNSKTLSNIQKWRKEVEPWLDDKFGLLPGVEFPVLVVGNKCDIAESNPIYTNSSGTIGVFENERWIEFLRNVSMSQKSDIEKANAKLEEYSNQPKSGYKLWNRFKNWLKPGELPLFNKR